MTSKLNLRFSGFERNARGLRVTFDVMGKGMLEGVVCASCTSGYAFPSYGAALKGARRALALVERTGKFPNMCDRF